MKNPIIKENIEKFENMRNPLTLQCAIKEANRCLLCHDAPCSKACPAGTDPGKFIRQMKFMNFKGAARTIRNNNILGSSCALICPVDKLCEEKCSALALEDPINIAGLQRFAGEYGIHNQLEKLQPGKSNGPKVAVIGAGPAGMACAAELAKWDFKVSVFEKNTHAGGMPFVTIPHFRLSAPALQHDVQNLLDLGVEIKYNHFIRESKQLQELKDQGFEAVFIATGLTEAFELPMLKDYDNALSYIDFLSISKTNPTHFDLKGKRIAVVGGGSVAVDAANTAKALEADTVYLISLEALPELPADAEEIRLAQLMNVVFKPSTQILHVESENNRIKALLGAEIKWKEPGNTHPANAEIIENSDFKIPVDLVISAIGTAGGSETPNLWPEVETHGKNLIQIDEEFRTNIPWIFSGGDIVNGGRTAVQAVSEGKKAAEAIRNFLTKK